MKCVFGQVLTSWSRSYLESEFDSVYEAVRDSMWVVNHMLVRNHNCKIKGIFIILCSEFWYITSSDLAMILMDNFLLLP